MIEPPHELNGAKVLKYAVATALFEPTGATRHTVGGIQWVRPLLSQSPDIRETRGHVSSTWITSEEL